ncbi:MAG: hypothetical protein QOK43_2555 [Acidimicrobiaceae bacterium]|nr:hypothetical protein [Acidimicrobiaceae bacterium]
MTGVGSSPTVEWFASLEQFEVRAGDFVFSGRAAGPTEGRLVLLLHGFPQSSL